MLPANRLVISPHGPPRGSRTGEHVQRLVRACGGDLSRVIEGPLGGPERFAQHLQRVAALRNPREQAVVVFTRTAPVDPVVLTVRERLTAAVPPLHRASWVVFVDPVEDAEFEHAALARGTLSGELHHAPIWSTHDGQHFLVVTPGVYDGELVGQRMAELVDLTAEESSVRRSVPPMDRPSNPELEIPQLSSRRL